MPNKLTQEKIKDNFIRSLLTKTAGNISQACQLVGRSRQAINEWRKDDEYFDVAVQNAIVEAKSDLADLAESCLKKRIESGDTTAIIFTLKSLRREFYGDSITVEAFKKATEPEPLPVGVKTHEDALTWASVWVKTGMYKAQTFHSITPEQKQAFDNLLSILKEKPHI